LDKLNRNFLWGDTTEKKKIHLLNWSKVCTPKANGGLGLKRAADMNQAMLAKASWRIVQKDEGLWCKVFEKKYLQRHSILDDKYDKHVGCSSTWNSVLHGAKLLRSGLCWRVGDGNLIKFWMDDWTGLGPLSNFALHSDAIVYDALIHDFWSDNDWNIQLLSTCLPSHIVDQISKYPISQSGDVSDNQVWRPSSNGNFSVSSAYQLAISSENSSTGPWKRIWALNIPPKLKVFAWTVAHGRLLTNVQRYTRHLCPNPCCQFCPGNAETMLHLLRDCCFARKVWAACKIPTMLTNFFQLDWTDWLSANVLKCGCSWNLFKWNECFIFICWYIWKWRNKGVFDSQFKFPENPFLIILHFAQEWFSIHKQDARVNVKQTVVLQWTKPPHNCFKLNVDGSKSVSGVIGAGGVIRDWSGNWVQGFSHYIGAGEIFEAEVWGLYIGLKMAVDLQLKNLLVESDSVMAVNLLNAVDISLHPLATIIGNCRNLMKLFESCMINHVYREKNSAADAMAKYSLVSPRGTTMFYSPPSQVAGIVYDDIAGVGHPRTLG
jgi:ribonuclease HI